jgi:hypothetical protein
MLVKYIEELKALVLIGLIWFGDYSLVQFNLIWFGSVLFGSGFPIGELGSCRRKTSLFTSNGGRDALDIKVSEAPGIDYFCNNWAYRC